MKEVLRFHGAIFDLVSRKVEINGHLHNRDIVLHPGGVSLLCVRDDQILLVRQMRHAVGEYSLEIPAGTLEKGEDPLQCGLRELNEETGYECDEAREIQVFYPTPGYTSEKLYIFKCTGLKKARRRLAADDDEQLEVIWMPLEKAWEMVRKSEIRDAKTIIAIQHELLERGNG